MRKNIRCAIYTRKSSEEGLEQDFNSLDAQREACAAYVASQASEGWSLIDDLYDDGGISGGTLERPALQRLLQDVNDGRIDTIVVYKVDRLTRSLLDFARLVEAFDEAEVSFVSVTQSFNTTTSMGRLTLNMLLSFAQFEREVTAERIRDKIAQSKARGMWMGGTPPLGYQPDGNNGLTIVEDHAAFIRDIYARYLRLGNVRTVAEELEADGVRTPQRTRQNGSTFGDRPFARGQLYHILKNPIYAGNIPHKDKVYPGNHTAIIEADTWEAVRLQLAEHVRGTRRTREGSVALLAGKLFDPQGKPLIPVHTSKPTGKGSARRRYSYYVSRSAHHGEAEPASPALRIPAREIEQAVAAELAKVLTDPLQVIQTIQPDLLPHAFEATRSRLKTIRDRIRDGNRRPSRQILKQAIVYPDQLELVLSVKELAGMLGLAAPEDTEAQLSHTASVRLTRSGHSLKLVDDAGVSAGASKPDPTLTGLLIQARQWWGELAKGEIDIAKLSRRKNVTASWMTRVVRLAFLAPDVVEALFDGRLPAKIDGKALLAPGKIAPHWQSQVENILQS